MTMSIPPSVKKIAPSLQIKNGETMTLSLADLKGIFPSLEINLHNSSVPSDGTVKMSITDLRKILRVALAGTHVDEAWYLGQVPGLRKDIQKGEFESASEHYVMHGYLEGLLPERPIVDEKFYLQHYPDIAAAIKSGTVISGYEHFVRDGYSEGRMMAPSKSAMQRAGRKK
jgi:hypothetical protein